MSEKQGEDIEQQTTDQKSVPLADLVEHLDQNMKPKGQPLPAMPAGLSEELFLSSAWTHVSTGSQKIVSAFEKANHLAKGYRDEAKTHRNRKWLALMGESLFMAFYGYGAMEHFTGQKGTYQAVAVNAGLSGSLSAFRAWAQYNMMKEGEASFSKGKTARGVGFLGVGLFFAGLHAAFIGTAFADKYIVEEQALAQSELETLFNEEQALFEEQSRAVAAVNLEIAEMDDKITELKAGNKDPRIEAMNAEIDKLQARIDELDAHPRNNDGKWDRLDRIAEENKIESQARISDLTDTKLKLLAQIGEGLPPEQQAMVDAAMEQRGMIVEKLNSVNERFQSQFDALNASRSIWENKLESVSQLTDSFDALMNNGKIALEAAASCGVVCIANWVAGVKANKQEKLQQILSGVPDDPWAEDDGQPKGDLGKEFMGYAYDASDLYHLQHKTELNALLQTKMGNPEAIRIEMREEVGRLHASMVENLNQNKLDGIIDGDEYNQQLDSINTAYSAAIDSLKKDETLYEITRVMTDVPKGSIVDDHLIDVPVFENETDSGFDQHPVGGRFQTPGEDGQLANAMKVRNPNPNV